MLKTTTDSVPSDSSVYSQSGFHTKPTPGKQAAEFQHLELARPPVSKTNHLCGIHHQISGVLALRHPHSKHNELGIFNGAPECKDRYGLTQRGLGELVNVIPALIKWVDSSGKRLVLLHSDFLRTRQAANLIYRALEHRVVKIEERQELRERNPGSLEGLPYRKILSAFGLSAKEEEEHHNSRGRLKTLVTRLIHQSALLAKPGQKLFGLEPCSRVEDRMTGLIREVHSRQQEDRHLYLLVGHEFSTAIALNAFLFRPPGMFWTNRHIPRASPIPLSVENARFHFLNDLKQQSLPAGYRG